MKIPNQMIHSCLDLERKISPSKTYFTMLKVYHFLRHRDYSEEPNTFPDYKLYKYT